MEPSPQRQQVRVAVAIVWQASGQRVLVCQRKSDTVLGGYWEFPGGKCHVDETLEQCALREVEEEVGLRVQIVARLRPIEHAYPHAYVVLTPFICRETGGMLQPLAVAEARWIPPEEILTYRFPPANAELLTWVAAGYASLLEHAEA